MTDLNKRPALEMADLPTRPVPELPEGYIVYNNVLSYASTREIVALVGNDTGRLFVEDGLHPQHWPALAAFLQGAR